MLVGFIGAPCSGKTTAAASLFARLKDSKVSAEFITEEARIYIAQKKLHTKERPVTLTSDEQGDIFHRQLQKESMLKRACDGDTVIISDSSAFNSLFYVDDKMRSAMMGSVTGPTRTESSVDVLRNHYDLIFFCKPVADPAADSNRIHSIEESLQIHYQIPGILRAFTPWLLDSPYLTGPTHARVSKAFDSVVARMAAQC